MNEQYAEELKWWAKKLHNYEELDSLSDEESKRVILSCLECIVGYLKSED